MTNTHTHTHAPSMPALLVSYEFYTWQYDGIYWQNKAEHMRNQQIVNSGLFSLPPSRMLKRNVRKGDRFKTDLSRQERGQTQHLTMASPCCCVFLVWKADKMEAVFFSPTPLGNVIFHTALAVFKWWQTGHNKVWHTESVTQTIPPTLKEYVSDNMTAWLQLQLRDQFGTLSAMQHCSPETALQVAIWWPLAKTQSRLLKRNISKSDSVNLLLWHACTEKGPDYP
jgi:hypothetical protein